MPKMPERERAVAARLEVLALQSIVEDVLDERVRAAKNDGTAFNIIKPAAIAPADKA